MSFYMPMMTLLFAAIGKTMLASSFRHESCLYSLPGKIHARRWLCRSKLFDLIENRRKNEYYFQHFHLLFRLIGVAVRLELDIGKLMHINELQIVPNRLNDQF